MFNEVFKIRILVEGMVNGKWVALTKEFGHYCVEYTNTDYRGDWWNPCEEDEIIIRNLYWRLVKNGKKLSKKEREEKFLKELVTLMREWDYNI